MNPKLYEELTKAEALLEEGGYPELSDRIRDLAAALRDPDKSQVAATELRSKLVGMGGLLDLYPRRDSSARERAQAWSEAMWDCVERLGEQLDRLDA